MRDDKRSIDGVLRPGRQTAAKRKIGLDNEKLLRQKKVEADLEMIARRNARAKRAINVEKPSMPKDMGSFVEPEDMKEQEDIERKQKPVKLSKKGQRKLFKAIQKGKVDPNHPAEIRAFAVKFRRKTRVKRFFGFLVFLGILVLGVLAAHTFGVLGGALDGIFAGGNIFDLVRKDPLKKDQNGRTNILIVGTDGFSEEDKSHPGAGLTDTMMVLSFSEEDGDVFMISLPRDMEVMHECSGWLGTWYGKLNETYPCALEEPGATFESASDITRATVSEILGLDIQYFVDVNFRVLIDVVDTLGGVTVEVANDGDPRGILDRNFDWACPNGPYTCFFVRYEKDEVVHLDGVHALALARARGAAGGYGLSRSNFDREVNQQRILIAIAEKAKETNFIGNPNKVLELISSLGRNIQTTFKVSEIRTLIDLAESLSAEGDIASRAKSIPLLNDERPNYSVVDGTGQPLAGQFRFTAIQRLINQAVTGQLDWWDTPSVNGETNGAAGW